MWTCVFHVLCSNVCLWAFCLQILRLVSSVLFQRFGHLHGILSDQILTKEASHGYMDQSVGLNIVNPFNTVGLRVSTIQNGPRGIDPSQYGWILAVRSRSIWAQPQSDRFFCLSDRGAVDPNRQNFRQNVQFKLRLSDWIAQGSGSKKTDGNTKNPCSTCFDTTSLHPFDDI